MTADTMTKDQTIQLQAAEIEGLREASDLDLDWNRLRSGDMRALNADHQDVFNFVFDLQAENERLRGLVYYVLPSEPFASDGITWKQESERLLNLLASEQELRLGPR